MSTGEATSVMSEDHRSAEQEMGSLSVSRESSHTPTNPHPPAPRPKRWTYLDNLRQTPQNRADADFNAKCIIEAQESMKVLVIGAGGLGCEILKDLALSGFKNIHVIDMDTIDVSNLNRQFLFRHSDVGKSKAEVAADFVMKRVKGVKITPHNCKIQDKDDKFYMQFQHVVCGLDSIEARRWINAKLVDLVDPNNFDSLKFLVDGGTEGLKGQVRTVWPTLTSCIECQLDLIAPRAAVPLCTLATIPRQPEHCIEWAHIMAWEQEKPFPKLDNDDPVHITWLYRKALERAKEFNISGVTYSLTQGVVKNIIPAIASTNAIIAAACCNEAFKAASQSAPFLGEENNYMQYSGDNGLYAYTFKHDKRDDCPVCGQLPRELNVNADITVEELKEKLQTDYQLKKPSIRSSEKSIYMQSIASLERATRPNLEKKLKEFVAHGDEISVDDPSLSGVVFRFTIRYD